MFKPTLSTDQQTVPSIDHLKIQAKLLRGALKSKFGIEIQHGQSLDLLARQFGCKDWNILRAKAVPNHASCDESKRSDFPSYSDVVEILKAFILGSANPFLISDLSAKLNSFQLLRSLSNHSRLTGLPRTPSGRNDD